ncbi:hypothetical protein BLNAU_1518 [Blattamonas nauphoetae]|uniref:Myotubularin phosphatase domain-containing protein n=1 Tax=Blattamonas nauphoetae TaxID=2049346 RepID=A0ABQ9YI93_9EUKA|nr:hypothetical protein BLNAU_1518 [Blattamonas nauphoetae]
MSSSNKRVINKDSLVHLFQIYLSPKHFPERDKHIHRIQRTCHRLFERDYLCIQLNNEHAVLCPSYPQKITIPVIDRAALATGTYQPPVIGDQPPSALSPINSDRQSEKRKKEQNAIEFEHQFYLDRYRASLFKLSFLSRTARARRRFPVRVICLSDGKCVCRSSTLALKLETVYREILDYFHTLSARMGKPIKQNHLSLNGTAISDESPSLLDVDLEQPPDDDTKAELADLIQNANMIAQLDGQVQPIYQVGRGYAKNALLRSIGMDLNAFQSESSRPSDVDTDADEGEVRLPSFQDDILGDRVDILSDFMSYDLSSPSSTEDDTEEEEEEESQRDDCEESNDAIEPENCDSHEKSTANSPEQSHVASTERKDSLTRHSDAPMLRRASSASFDSSFTAASSTLIPSKATRVMPPTVHINDAYASDSSLLTFYGVTVIADLMTETTRKWHGLSVAGSERAGNSETHSKFHLLSLPFPGCEYMVGPPIHTDTATFHQTLRLVGKSTDTPIASKPFSEFDGFEKPADPLMGTTTAGTAHVRPALEVKLGMFDKTFNPKEVMFNFCDPTVTAKIIVPPIVSMRIKLKGEEDIEKENEKKLRQKVGDELKEACNAELKLVDDRRKELLSTEEQERRAAEIAERVMSHDFEKNRLSQSSPDRLVQHEVITNGNGPVSIVHSNMVTHQHLASGSISPQLSPTIHAAQAPSPTNSTSSSTHQFSPILTPHSHPTPKYPQFLPPSASTFLTLPSSTNPADSTENLLSIVQSYLLLLLNTLATRSFSVHCISGWDRTPFFVALVRVLLWADGECHKSLSPLELAYLLVGYDFLLFTHQLTLRLHNGEHVLAFFISILPHLLNPTWFRFSKRCRIARGEKEDLPKHSTAPRATRLNRSGLSSVVSTLPSSQIDTSPPTHLLSPQASFPSSVPIPSFVREKTPVLADLSPFVIEESAVIGIGASSFDQSNLGRATRSLSFHSEPSRKDVSDSNDSSSWLQLPRKPHIHRSRRMVNQTRPETTLNNLEQEFAGLLKIKPDSDGTRTSEVSDEEFQKRLMSVYGILREVYTLTVLCQVDPSSPAGHH